MSPAVFDDFVARSGGRIFDTAGDSALAEFASAVDGVRSAIDVQENFRTRNPAGPASRQSFALASPGSRAGRPGPPPPADRHVQVDRVTLDRGCFGFRRVPKNSTQK
jgi:hypothetical protein